MTHKLRVPVLPLPLSLPKPEAIVSSNSSLTEYEPDMWELRYRVVRYLERMSDTMLQQRYRDIVRNLERLVSVERDVIPIDSFLSSWYWFRKEHQTRLEFQLREAEVPAPPTGQLYRHRDAPRRAKHPNYGDVLFRYGRMDHLLPTLYGGTIRVAPASTYKDMESDAARQDEERSKTAFTPGRHVTFTTEDGRKFPILGDLQTITSAPNYYVICMSTEWDVELFTDLRVNGCLVITEPEKFTTRLAEYGASAWPHWFFHHNPIEYFDPYDVKEREHVDPLMSKDFRFAYQREYRFIWLSPQGRDADHVRFLNLGGLHDIAELYGIDGTKHTLR